MKYALVPLWQNKRLNCVYILDPHSPYWPLGSGNFVRGGGPTSCEPNTHARARRPPVPYRTGPGLGPVRNLIFASKNKAIFEQIFFLARMRMRVRPVGIKRVRPVTIQMSGRVHLNSNDNGRGFSNGCDPLTHPLENYIYNDSDQIIHRINFLLFPPLSDSSNYYISASAYSLQSRADSRLLYPGRLRLKVLRKL